MNSLYVKGDYQEKAHLLKLISSYYALNDVSICPTYRKPFDLMAKGLNCTNWLPTVDSKCNSGRLSKYKEIHILVKMYRRRGKGTSISLYDPLPSLPQKPAPVYKNIVAMAVKVNEYLVQNPQRTYTSAGNRFGVTRARISQLMTIHEKLPDDFIEMMGQCDDQNLIKCFSGKTLLKISRLKTEKEQKNKIKQLMKVAK